MIGKAAWEFRDYFTVTTSTAASLSFQGKDKEMNLEYPSVLEEPGSQLIKIICK